MKKTMTCILVLFLMIALNSCAPASDELPSAAPSDSSSSSFSGSSDDTSSSVSSDSSSSSSSSSSRSVSLSEQSSASDEYTVRFPEGWSYHWLERDYSDIYVEDSAGNDITNIAIDLWYCANCIYNVDNPIMFEIGEFASLQEYAIPQSFELLNYYDVVENIFTKSGIAQLEQTAFHAKDNFLIRKIGDAVYRMDGYKSGFSIADTFIDMQVTERSDNRINLSVQYIVRGNIDPGEPGYSEPVPFTVDFTIAKVNGQWLVDDYVYPEAC